jgi:putative ABC transport system ATP-binding protein
MQTAARDASEAVVRLRDVHKSYTDGTRRHEVLHGVDLDIARGEFLALVGRSGSGKSTLLNLIGGMDDPDSGSLEVLGLSMATADEPRRSALRRTELGFVFQFFNLLPTLTVEENLLLPLELARKLDAASRARALELLDAVGLSAQRRSFPDRLSGGEQQRAAIARALAHDPELVLADEPTGNLDDENAARVLELFVALLRPQRKTLVLVTHSAAAARVADRTLELRDGRLVERSAGA